MSGGIVGDINSDLSSGVSSADTFGGLNVINISGQNDPIKTVNAIANLGAILLPYNAGPAANGGMPVDNPYSAKFALSAPKVSALGMNESQPIDEQKVSSLNYWRVAAFGTLAVIAIIVAMR